MYNENRTRKKKKLRTKCPDYGGEGGFRMVRDLVHVGLYDCNDGLALELHVGVEQLDVQHGVHGSGLGDSGLSI